MKTSGSNGEARDGMLAVRVEGDGAARTIVLRGELDLSNASILSSSLERVEAEGPKTITIDMSELEFIDSTGIAVLVAAHRRLGSRDGLLRFVPGRAAAVRRVMQVTGLDHELSFEPGEKPTGAANA